MSRTIRSNTTISDNKIYLSIRLHDVYCVWIKSNKQFVLLQSPAYFVFSAIVFDQSEIEILKTFCEIYFYNKKEAQSFIHNIAQLTNNLFSKPVPQLPSNKVYTERVSDSLFRNVYQFGKSQIVISGNNKSLRRYYHPLISHLEVYSENVNHPEIQLEMDRGSLSIRRSNQIAEVWKEADNGFFKGAVFAEILSKIYDKNEDDWMMTMHASGITNGESAILFSAPAGSGKSTVAAFLSANGYDLLSDDFLAVDREARVYRFPIAITVKEGSLDLLSGYYDELLDVEPVRAMNAKTVRYLPPRLPKKARDIFPIKAIVFVNFVQGQQLHCVELSPAEAAHCLLPEIFVEPVESNIIAFLQWIGSVSFYQLNYSEVEQLNGIVQQIYADV